MIRSNIKKENETANILKKKRINHKKTQFVEAKYIQQDYSHRLSLYEIPPTNEVSLEDFETWAIARLRILSELENCSARNRSAEETAAHLEPLLKEHLPLSANPPNTTRGLPDRLIAERRKDHYSHWILRLAFSSTEDLRRRYSRIETQLFRHRFRDTPATERRAFIESLNLEWEQVSEQEKQELSEQLLACTPSIKRVDEESWFKVNWTRVPDLVEHRSVYLRKGKAYVPMRAQESLVLAEFSKRLDKALEQSARALPRIDEDDRLSPILSHLSKSFGTPDAGFNDSAAALPGAPITAANIDALVPHMPLCMRNLHLTLRKNSHLKHYGRLQYTLFLKGIGLTLDDCLIFWRQAFKTITDDTFNKEYRYNVRHAYGDVGGDGNRRGRGYTPYSCQKILTEHPPGTGEAHGCPYRHFAVDNLIGMLGSIGISDRSVLQVVREDVERKRYHIACNRVFEHVHKNEIKKVREDGTWGMAELDTIVHPNTYFKRSYLLKNLGSADLPKTDVKMEDA